MSNFKEGDKNDEEDNIHPNQKLEIQEAQRLSQLYRAHVNCVATSTLRIKRKNLVFTADTKDTHVSTQFLKAIRRFSQPVLSSRGNNPLDRLSTPKFTVFKEEAKELLDPKFMFCTERPWFLGYQMNSLSSLPPGSKAVLAKRYGYHSAIRLTRKFISSSVKSVFRLANIPEEQIKVPLKLKVCHDAKCVCGRPLTRSTKEKMTKSLCMFCNLFLTDNDKMSTIASKNKEVKRPLSLHLLKALSKEREAWMILSKGVTKEKVDRIQTLNLKDHFITKNKANNRLVKRYQHRSTKEINKRIFSLR